MQPVLKQGITWAEFDAQYDNMLVKMGTASFPEGYEPLSLENYGKFKEGEMLLGGVLLIRSCTEKEDGTADCHLKQSDNGQGYFMDYKVPVKNYNKAENPSVKQFSLFGLELNWKTIGIGILILGGTIVLINSDKIFKRKK